MSLSKVLIRVGARSSLILKMHSPKILFGVGVVGLVGTIATAARAGERTAWIAEEHKEDYKNNDEMLESERITKESHTKNKVFLYTITTKKLAKVWWPVAACSVVTIAAFGSSNYILTKRVIGLVAAYKSLDEGFSLYRDRVINELGPDKDREFRHGVQTKTLVKDTDTGPVKHEVRRVAPGTPSIYARYFDETSSKWERNPDNNFIFLKANQNYLNDLLVTRGHIFLNEVYALLGMEHSPAGAVVGWVLNAGGDNYIDFGIFDADNPRARAFVNGHEGSILLDFNVDGVIYDKIKDPDRARMWSTPKWRDRDDLIYGGGVEPEIDI